MKNIKPDLLIIFIYLYIAAVFSLYAEEGTKYADLNKIKLEFTQEEQAWLDNNKSIRISGPRNFPPFHFYSEDDKAVGIASDYVNIILSSLGIEIQSYEKLSWPDVLSKAEEKELDLIACSAWSRERERYLNYTKSFLSFPMVIISRNDFKFIAGLEDLINTQVALVKGVVISEWLDQDNISVLPYVTSSPLESLEAVSTGTADAYIGNLATVSYLITTHGYTNLKIAAPTHYKNYDLFIAVRKDWPELVSIINKWLSVVSPQQHSAIRNEWLSVKYEHGLNYFDIIKYVLLSAVIFGSLIATVMFWNRRLKSEIESRKKAQKEKEAVIIELKDALENIDILGGLLPICSNCKKIKDDSGYWDKIEHYFETNSDFSFSHGLCPDCEKSLYGEEEWYIE